MNICCKKNGLSNVFFSTLLLLLLLLSCHTKDSIKSDEYFFVKIDNKPWHSQPFQLLKKYSVSYKALSHQISILAQSEDGSRMEVSFHDAGPLKTGNYPSTINDEGIQSGIFYAPKHGDLGKEMSSVTYDVPVQENTVKLTKLDKRDQKAYIIEGTFSSTLYALYPSNPKRTVKLTEGKFRIIYYPDAYNPEF
jgi:hypothetical protein